VARRTRRRARATVAAPTDRQTDYAGRVTRPALLAVLVVAGLAPVVLGAPVASQRVVLADPDPELRHAMEQVLAPWHLEVVIEGPAPFDAAMAQQRADADTARFVVWREGEQLVVYDRELGFTERRASGAGPLDPPTAAAAALTLKTMMRLPPPPTAPESAPPPAAAVERGRARGIDVRIQAGIAARFARGGDADTTARFGAAVAIRPWPSAGWRFGLAGDRGTSTAISRASFNGTWSEWALVGLVSWSHALGAWEFEPYAGGGIRRSALDGTEMNDPRSEAATLATARGGLWVRWRWSRWTLGAAFAFDRSFGTPTYSKNVGAAEIFQVPATALELGSVVAVEL